MRTNVTLNIIIEDTDTAAGPGPGGELVPEVYRRLALLGSEYVDRHTVTVSAYAYEDDDEPLDEDAGPAHHIIGSTSVTTSTAADGRMFVTIENANPEPADVERVRTYMADWYPAREYVLNTSSPAGFPDVTPDGQGTGEYSGRAGG